MAKFATAADVQPLQVADPPLIPQPSPADPPAWVLDMDAAPHDGRLVVLTDDVAADGVRAVWYVARSMGRPWQKAPEGWMGVEPRQWVPFTPVAWRLP